MLLQNILFLVFEHLAGIQRKKRSLVSTVKWPLKVMLFVNRAMRPNCYMYLVIGLKTQSKKIRRHLVEQKRCTPSGGYDYNKRCHVLSSVIRLG